MFSHVMVRSIRRYCHNTLYSSSGRFASSSWVLTFIIILLFYVDSFYIKFGFGTKWWWSAFNEWCMIYVYSVHSCFLCFNLSLWFSFSLFIFYLVLSVLCKIICEFSLSFKLLFDRVGLSITYREMFSLSGFSLVLFMFCVGFWG